MQPSLSIIIPCYNAEATLEGTLASVMNQDFQNWEALIINDGSTDATEEIALQWVQKDNRFKYFAKHNEGLGKTRNYGITRAVGTYILPLDSDNQLMPSFAKEAVAVFESQPEIGVVHGDAEYFGEKSGYWKVADYDFNLILADNYIDACAIYRRNLWVEVGGYDENMPYQGLEDWEFWIAQGVLKTKFHHLNKITFKYFVDKNSMIHSFTEEMRQLDKDYILNKYSNHYLKSYTNLYKLYKKNKSDYFDKLNSEKFVIDLFCSRFFNFSVFGKYKKR